MSSARPGPCVCVVKLGTMEPGVRVKIAQECLFFCSCWDLFVGGGGDGEKLYLVYSSINSFTQNKVCGVYCVLRTDTPGQNIAGQRRDISNFFFYNPTFQGCSQMKLRLRKSLYLRKPPVQVSGHHNLRKGCAGGQSPWQLFLGHWVEGQWPCPMGRRYLPAQPRAGTAELLRGTCYPGCLSTQVQRPLEARVHVFLSKWDNRALKKSSKNTVLYCFKKPWASPCTSLTSIDRVWRFQPLVVQSTCFWCLDNELTLATGVPPPGFQALGGP